MKSVESIFDWPPTVLNLKWKHIDHDWFFRCATRWEFSQSSCSLRSVFCLWKENGGGWNACKLGILYICVGCCEVITDKIRTKHVLKNKMAHAHGFRSNSNGIAKKIFIYLDDITSDLITPLHNYVISCANFESTVQIGVACKPR